MSETIVSRVSLSNTLLLSFTCGRSRQLAGPEVQKGSPKENSDSVELGRAALPSCGCAHQLGSSMNSAVLGVLLWLHYVGFYVNVLFFFFFLSDSHLLLNCTILILTKILAEISCLYSPSILHAITTYFTF